MGRLSRNEVGRKGVNSGWEISCWLKGIPQTYLGLIAPGAHVGEEDDLLVAHEARVDLGLLFEDVEPRAGDDAFIQGVDERGLVDDGTAGRVHDDGRGLHLRELGGREDVARRRVQGQVEAKHVAALQEGRERDVLGPVG